MENAVKALLIAAAVLIAILIISLGLVVYNKASETVNNAGDLSEYEIQQHNEKFTKYQGDNVSGADVNALVTTVYNYNLMNEKASRIKLTNASADTDFKDVEIGMEPKDFESSETDNLLSTVMPKVPTNKRYKIVCVMSNGMVTEIKVALSTETIS